MIDGHREKQGDKDDECPVTGVIPAHLVESYRADRPDDEQDETPAGKGGTGGCGQSDQAVEFRYQACQPLGFGRWRHWLVVEHSADLTGRGCPRQSLGVVMPDEWIDVSFRSDVDPAELLELLADPFVQGSWQNEDTI